MLLTEDFLDQWSNIVDQVDKNHVPIDFVKKVVFRTHTRRQKTVNLQRMREQGIDNESIEAAVEDFIRNNEHDIASMEFMLDIKAVAEALQPETDRLLKDM